MGTRLVHHLNAKCLSEKRVGQRRLQTAVRAIYDGDLAWRYAPTCGIKGLLCVELHFWYSILWLSVDFS